LLTLVVFSIFISAAPALAADAPPSSPAAVTTALDDSLDYQTLSHTLAIDSLRAGSHDESGTNDYHFTVTMYALLNTSEERNLDFAKRKQVTAPVGTFGATKIDSLAIWRPDEKTKAVKEIRIEGNTIRELTARAMRELNAREDGIAVMIEVVMIKRNKKFFFFGNDLPVAKISYYPIPATKFDTPIRTNQALTIADDKGTSVKLSVRYDKPASSAKSK
jgi:hypothetical protein